MSEFSDFALRTVKAPAPALGRLFCDGVHLGPPVRAPNSPCYFHLKDTGRLYRRNADGNRVYYSDEEADALREQARRAMTAACGR